jgi:hypothetical protein
MNTVASVPANLRLTDRLSFRLLALFMGIFLVTFFVLWAWSISMSFIEGKLAEEGAAARPQPIVIDPNLRDDLAKVMSYDTSTAPVSIKDPFNDRTGIVGASAAQRAVGGVVTTTGGSTNQAGTPNSNLASSRSNTSLVPGNPVGPGGVSVPQPSGAEATKERYKDWLENGATGGVPLNPRIFSIDDLLPVGVVDGGEGRQEVLFYSEAAGRTLSFAVGTEFNDGWLTELRPEGVVFASGDERRTYRLRSWARSLRNAG